MTHIANCMRPPLDKANVYMNVETSSKSPSLKNIKATSEAARPLESPTLGTSRFQFWSSSSKSPTAPPRTLSSDKLTALSMGRSPTSLSDTVVVQETLPFWQRSGSLSSRRKVSVPELGSTSYMTTVQEMPIDSPTIPGRPPLRKASTEAFGHERSSSAPGPSWRAGPFGDALVSCVTGPSALQLARSTSPGFDVFTASKADAHITTGKPLSPILSPSVKPALKVDTGKTLEGVELPPEVPPKSASLDRRGSPTPKLSSKSSRSQLLTPASLTSGGTTPLSAADSRRSPNLNPFPTPISASSNAFSATSPPSTLDRRGSPRVERRDPFSHNRNLSDTSVLDRGRPVRRSSKRERSRTTSEANNADVPAVDKWKLPTGMRASEASVRLNEADKEQLHKQAHEQAEKFEVLQKKDVASLSRELRALDERCDYLRKTYKSLRAGRQKLHSRMISYLKRGETVIFSRESLLKQEEALAELDVSIDEFILKLEQAENRRLRLRQKLLEHVAAALVMNTASTSRGEMAETTPPRSPVKPESPARPVNRKDVESIKIYADGHVMAMFADIEQAIGKMCEQAC